MNRPYKTYNGGKNGSGVYQAIINQIPPHDIFISGLAGNCGVLGNKIPAPMANIAIDLDAAVINDWNKIPGIIGVNADAIDWIEQFLLSQGSGNEIFIFLDPPYLKEVRSDKKDLYKFEMTDPATHKYLLQSLEIWDWLNASQKIKILITHYPCELYDNALKGWRSIDIQGRTRQGMRTERLYMNYPEPEELHDYRFFGANYRQRERLKKIQNNMVAKFKRMSQLEKNFIIHSLKQKSIL